MESNILFQLGVAYGSGTEIATLPETELWTRVILQAIDDLDRGDSLTSRLAQESARQWFASDYEGVGSFVWCCNVISVDPSFIRSSLAKKHRITPMTSSPQQLRRSRVRAFDSLAGQSRSRPTRSQRAYSEARPE